MHGSSSAVFVQVTDWDDHANHCDDDNDGDEEEEKCVSGDEENTVVVDTELKPNDS